MISFINLSTKILQLSGKIRWESWFLILASNTYDFKNSKKKFKKDSSQNENLSFLKIECLVHSITVPIDSFIVVEENAINKS